MRLIHQRVMAGFIPAIHVLAMLQEEKAWMAGTSPAMTKQTHISKTLDKNLIY
jgi:hypothetical protein